MHKELSSLIISNKKDLYDLKWTLANNDFNDYCYAYNSFDLYAMYQHAPQKYFNELINANFKDSLVTEEYIGNSIKIMPLSSSLLHHRCVVFKSDRFTLYVTDKMIDILQDRLLLLDSRRIKDSITYMKNSLIKDDISKVSIKVNYRYHVNANNKVETKDKVLSYDTSRSLYPIYPIQTDQINKLLEFLVERDGKFDDVIFNNTSLVAYNNREITIDIEGNIMSYRKIKEKVLELKREV